MKAKLIGLIVLILVIAGAVGYTYYQKNSRTAIGCPAVILLSCITVTIIGWYGIPNLIPIFIIGIHHLRCLSYNAVTGK